MKIIGVSGNPSKNGTVDKLLQIIMDKIVCEDKELIPLYNLDIKHCKACLECVKTNQCIQNDDWSSIEGTIKQADLMVLGVPTFYGGAFGINGLTHNFLERWFALRHRGLKTNIKQVILAVVSGEDHGEVAVNNLKTFFNAYHNIEVVDSIIAKGTTPCYKCGFGEECPLSAVLMRHGQDVKITEEMIPRLENQEEVMEKIKQITEKINSK